MMGNKNKARKEQKEKKKKKKKNYYLGHEVEKAIEESIGKIKGLDKNDVSIKVIRKK